MKLVLPILLSLMLTLVACSSNEPQPPPRWEKVSGTVSYRERMMLPPNSEVVVRLEDVSKMDVAAELMGETRFFARGGPPFDFAVKYDPDRINPRMRYALRASIYQGATLLFTTTSHTPAFESDDPVEIWVQRIGGSGKQAVIEGREWVLATLPGAEVGDVERIPTLTLQPEEGRVTGSAGCNRYFGSYEKDGTALSFGQAGATMMACAHGMELERSFLSMLEKVRQWKVHDGILWLLGEEGGELASFR